MDTSQIITIIASIVGTIGPAMWMFSIRLEKKASEARADIQQIYGRFEVQITKLSEQLSSLEQQSLINAQRLGQLEIASKDEYADLARYDERIKRLEQDVQNLSSKV